LTGAGLNLCRALALYREEKDSKMGLINVQYQVQQYHIEKEAKIEQEELIRQQHILTEQRKAME